MDSRSSFKPADSLGQNHRTIVHHLPHLVSAQTFSQIVSERKLLVSFSGQHLAVLQNNDCLVDHLDVVHQNHRTCTPITHGVLLQVAPKQILIWGQAPDQQLSGVYCVDHRQARLLQRLDRLDHIIQTPTGPMLKGANNDDETCFDRYVLPQGLGYLLTQGQASVSILTDGRISAVEEKQGRLCHSLWHPDGSLEEVKNFDPRQRVRVLPWQDGFAYVIDQGDSFVFETEGIDLFDFETHRELSGQVEHFWISPSQKHVFLQVRRPERGRLSCSYRQLYLDGQLVEDADGYFQMGPDDLRWSRDDSQFIARMKICRLDHQGQPVTHERLFTSRGTVFDAPAGFSLQDMAVDNHGEIMFYVLSDGQLHYPFYYGEPLEPATYIWNLRHFQRRLSGNRLDGSTIKQFRLDRR
ncbi:hypothetical protein KJ611_04190 [Patescibacteria group bacterium]|nr:hypothetical protein [Patescibacteria group bacterium]MBU1705911.1 hypothetical protein [Patescibacteria group bacterium]